MSEQLLVTPDTPWGYLGGIGGDIPHFGGYFSTVYFITLMFMTLKLWLEFLKNLNVLINSGHSELQPSQPMGSRCAPQRPPAPLTGALYPPQIEK